MKPFKDYSTHIRSTGKELLFDFFLPLLAEFAILVACIIPFRIFKSLGGMIQEPALVGKEQTMPTAGRLAFGLLALVLWFVCSFLASRSAKKGKIMPPRSSDLRQEYCCGNLSVKYPGIMRLAKCILFRLKALQPFLWHACLSF